MEKEVKFSKREAITFKLATFDVGKAKKVLHERTGLKFGKGNYIVQAVGILNAWMCCHTREDENSNEVVTLCVGMAAQQHIKDYGGSFALNEDRSEAFVYVKDPDGDYIIRVHKQFLSIAVDNNPAPDDEIFIPVDVITESVEQENTPKVNV